MKRATADVEFEHRIEALLAESLDSVRARERSALDTLLAAASGRVVVVGAGSTGKRTLGCLRSIGVEPLAIADDDPALHSSELDGAPIMSHAGAARRFGSDALFLIAIWNAKHWYAETAARLHDLGCVNVESIGPVYWRFGETFLPFFVQDFPHKVYEERSEVLRAATIWSDTRSRDQYLSHLRWRTHGEAGALPARTLQESYFADDIFALNADESLVDCGAYDGDTLRGLQSRRNDAFRRVDAIEPAPKTFAALASYVHGLPDSVRSKIALHTCALGSQPGTVRFDASCGVDSHVSERGEVLVNVRTLDELCQDSRPTFLKMDIEGSERDALLGARNIIQTYRPILAICLEHYQNDLWRLPLLMHDTVPGYRMFLRTYEGDGWQSVAYAVPEYRVKNWETAVR